MMTRLPPPLPCRYLIIFPTPSTDSQIQADPSLTETQKTWHLNWMPHAFLASFRPQRQPKRFIGEIWVKISGKHPGHPSHLCVHMLSHAHNALARILCSISTGSGGSSSYSSEANWLGPSPLLMVPKVATSFFGTTKEYLLENSGTFFSGKPRARHPKKKQNKSQNLLAANPASVERHAAYQIIIS